MEPQNALSAGTPFNLLNPSFLEGLKTLKAPDSPQGSCSRFQCLSGIHSEPFTPESGNFLFFAEALFLRLSLIGGLGS